MGRTAPNAHAVSDLRDRNIAREQLGESIEFGLVFCDLLGGSRH